MLFEQDAPLPPDPRSWRIALVLPTKDEQATLADVVAEIRSGFAAAGLAEPILIAADDSHDATRAIARSLGVRVVNGEGKGLGYAMRKGLRAALSFSPHVVMSMDSDGQSDPAEVMRFLEPLARGEADMVIGSRFLEKGLIRYRYPRLNRFGIVILSWMLRRVTGLPLTDSHGGLRAMRPEVVRNQEIIGTHTYVQETIIDALRKGYRVREVPSVWRPRRSGRSRVVGSISRYVMYTLPVLVIRSGQHVRWPYRIAFVASVAAVLVFGQILWQSGFVPERIFLRTPALILIALLVIVASQLFTFGLLTEILGLIKLQVDRLDRSVTEAGEPEGSAQPERTAEPATGPAATAGEREARR